MQFLFVISEVQKFLKFFTRGYHNQTHASSEYLAVVNWDVLI